MIWPLDYRYNFENLFATLCDWCSQPQKPAIAITQHLLLDNTTRKVRYTYACPNCAVEQPWETNPLTRRR